MADTGEVLFQKGQDDNEEDIWDDTALIKAYDDAVSLMKMKVAEQNGLDLTEQVASSAGKMKGKKKKKRNKNKKQIQWKQGDLCRAKYTEDGCVYDAEIISIDDACGTCTVRYLNYENEEEQDLKNLQQPKRRSLAAKSLEQSEAETDSGMDFKSAHSSTRLRSSRTPSHAQQFAPGLPPWGGPAPDRTSHKPMGFIPPHMPMFPPQHGVFHPAWGSSQAMPMMPPPPPPPPLPDMSEKDNEALCSMLMAWYMSGYHTGYYQGLQQGKKTFPKR